MQYGSYRVLQKEKTEGGSVGIYLVAGRNPLEAFRTGDIADEQAGSD